MKTEIKKIYGFCDCVIMLFHGTVLSACSVLQNMIVSTLHVKISGCY